MMSVLSPNSASKALSFPFKSSLQGGGQFEVDRPLPLVCIHDRSTRSHPRDPSLELLTQGAPNHFVLEGASELTEAEPLIQSCLQAATKEFGGCVLVELTSSERRKESTTAPLVKISAYGSAAEELGVAAALDAFQAELTRQKVRGLRPLVTRGHTPLPRATLEPFQHPRVTRIVLELDPVFFTPREDKLRGLLLRDFAERLHPALAHMAYSLIDAKGKKRLGGPCAIGRRHVGPDVDAIVRELARVSQSFDLLLLLTPTNGEAAYRRFAASGYETRPEFLYRTIYIDPDELRRVIYQLPIEKVADPTLARLLRDQREHLDNELGMVAHRNTSKCLYSSLHVYGSVEDKLYRVARGVAEAFGSDVYVVDDDSEGASVDLIGAEEFCRRVLSEFEFYKKQSPAFEAKVEIRDDVSSLIVSEDTLFVPRHTALSKRRTDALLAHEVGTHLLTYCNGKSQPLGLMKSGLAGYDQLQEGLAVVAEYLAGGLTPERLRLLAARVIAVRHLLRGAEFVEVFREVHKTLALPKRHAFFVTLRVFRGGGFTKDAIYLRGVLDVLEHLRQERPFETLLMGKFSVAHAPLIDELRCRQLLKPPSLLPRALKTASGRRHLAALVGQPRTVFDLCQREAS